MMQRTDRHFRYMMRCISRRVLLYTEMVTTGALLNGHRERFLGFDPSEHPVALQLGGDDAGMLAECAQLAEERGYDEVNLNIGCPSPRVQRGNFGACLMQTPEVVARCVSAMIASTNIPVTVKHRIGVDDMEDWEDLRRFVETVAEAGCERFTVHARKAWLKGLSPKENRNVPPLNYDIVYRLKEEFPRLVIELNGHIKSVSEMSEHLERVDAVMIGRGAYDDPWTFASVDTEIYGEPAVELARADVARRMAEYTADRLEQGDRLPLITRHLLNLFARQPGSRAWRRHLTEASVRDGANATVILQALELVDEVRVPSTRPERQVRIANE